MRYADDTQANEAKAEEMGERNIVTSKMLAYFVGGDRPDAEAWEMLLDILNNHWPLEDAVREVRDHFEED